MHYFGKCHRRQGRRCVQLDFEATCGRFTGNRLHSSLWATDQTRQRTEDLRSKCPKCPSSATIASGERQARLVGHGNGMWNETVQWTRWREGVAFAKDRLWLGLIAYYSLVSRRLSSSSLSLSREWSGDTAVEQRWFEWMSHRHTTRLFFSDSAWPECKWYPIRGNHSFSILFCYLFSVLMTGQAFGFYCFHFHWHVCLRSLHDNRACSMNERIPNVLCSFSRSRNDLIKEQLDWRRPMDHSKTQDEFENISFSLFPFSLYLFDNICREDSKFLSFFVNKDEIVFLSNDNHPKWILDQNPSVNRSIFLSFSFIFKHFVVNDNDLLSYFNCVSKVAE